MKFMKQLSFFAILASLTVQAQAIEPWQGERRLIVTDTDFPYYSKVFLQGNRGRVATRDGSSKVRVSHSEGTLTLDILNPSSISSTSYPFKQNIETGDYEQVTAQTHTKSISIDGSENNAYLKITKETCYRYTSNIASENIQCGTTVDEMDKPIIVTEYLPTLSLDIIPGDKVVIPGQYDHFYLQLNADKSVTNLNAKPQSATALDTTIVDNVAIESWSLQNNILNLHFQDGGKATYKAIQDFEGVKRVIGTFIKGNTEITLFGGLVVDDTTAAFEDVSSAAGDYVVSLVATTNMGTHLIYEFDTDSFGGFNTSSFSLEPYYSLWTWSVKNGVIEAQQYRSIDPSATGRINDKQELKACLRSLKSAQPSCVLDMSRAHRLLQVDGNRVTVLRTMKRWSTDENGQMNLIYQNSAPFVLYKK